MPVILSAAKDLAQRTHRSFAALRMTGIPLQSVHRKSSLQMSANRGLGLLSIGDDSCLMYTVLKAISNVNHQIHATGSPLSMPRDRQPVNVQGQQGLLT